MEELCHYIHQQVMMTASTKVANTDNELSQLMRCCCLLILCVHRLMMVHCRFLPNDQSVDDDSCGDVWRSLYRCVVCICMLLLCVCMHVCMYHNV